MGLDMTSSDVDDDFDDRFIHLIAAHSEINKAYGVFHPDQTPKAIWDVTCMLAIIYQSIVIPFRLCFNEDAVGGMYIFESIIDCIFLVDITISFNTGFYQKGYLVMKRRDIVINYMKTWFLIDLIASFPYSWVFPTDNSSPSDPSYSAVGAPTYTYDPVTGDYNMNQAYSNGGQSHVLNNTSQLLRIIRIVRFLRFLRLLRVFKLKKLLYKFEEIIMSDTINAIMGFLKVITVILFIAHWIACIFYFIGST